MNIWVVSREYAGIAEAGGVKNVACSLSESLAKAGHSVTLFIPLYGCTDLSSVSDFICFFHRPVTITICGKEMTVSFSAGKMNGVNIVFIGNRAFSEKKAVYTYTREEESLNPCHCHGEGHEDAMFLNSLFQKTVAYYGTTCSKEEMPDIIHCQDAPAALVPVFVDYLKRTDRTMKSFYGNTKCLVTIHNAGPGYHHQFCSLQDAVDITSIPACYFEKAMNGTCCEPFLAAAACGASITTVSPEYALEILEGKTETAGLTEGFLRLNTGITGITNGIDTDRYDPCDTKKSLLPYPFSPEKMELEGKKKCLDYLLSHYASLASSKKQAVAGIEQYGYIRRKKNEDPVYIAFHGRIVSQKGISVLAKAADMLLQRKLPVKFIFIGQGQPDLERELLQVALKYEGDCVFFRGYDRALSRLCVAACNFAVFPSFFEPCGLEDFIAQVYGTLPVAHATGGLCKIISEETGFLYGENTPEELSDMLYSLIKIMDRAGKNIFNSMVCYAASYVRENYSWQKVAQKYTELYESLK